MKEKMIRNMDYDKINHVLQRMIYSGSPDPVLLEFAALLEEARTPDMDVPDNVIGLNHSVVFTELASGELMSKTLVLPPVDFDAGELSVFSPIGMGLIGAFVSDEIDCSTPSGSVRIRIESLSCIESEFI